MTQSQRSITKGESFPTSSARLLSNAEIADRLASLAQLLSAQKENPYKVRAYQRAAARIRQLPESLDEMVRGEEDLTQFAGVGKAIASAIREIVSTGALRNPTAAMPHGADARPYLLSDFLTVGGFVC